MGSWLQVSLKARGVVVRVVARQCNDPRWMCSRASGRGVKILFAKLQTNAGPALFFEFFGAREDRRRTFPRDCETRVATFGMVAA
jgi:hypothetical protein